MCVAEVCTSASCGDGIVQEGEECEPRVGKGAEAGCSEECTYLRGARSIALGADHTCVVTQTGGLRCWGNGDRGKTGLGTTASVGLLRGEPASAPNVDVGGDVDRVALGTGFSCALRETNDVVCWGFRDAGRLGDGASLPMEDIADERGETAGELGPLMMPGPTVDLAVGGSHACALRDTGQVYCWGSWTAGKLGYGMEGDVGESNTPSSVGPVPMPEGFAPRQLAAGAGHTCAMSDDGRVLCWGDAATGILGTMSAEDIGDDEPASVGGVIELGGAAQAISAGSQHTCALLIDGVVRCWGLGDNGRLGYGNSDDVGDDEDPGAFTVELPTTAMQVSAGRAHTCALLDGGDVLCWGEGSNGQLGQAGTDSIGEMESLINVEAVIVDDDRGASVIAVEAGGDHTCAVLSDGRVRCWGAASEGQLGYGNDDKIGDDEVPDAAGDVDFGP